MRFGAVIATNGKRDQLDRVLQNLKEQPGIVCAAVNDQSDTSRIKEICTSIGSEDFPIIVTSVPNGISAGRNAAAAEIYDKCDYILFIDDDSIVTNLDLEQMRRIFSDSEVVAGCGSYEWIDGKKISQNSVHDLTKANVWAEAVEPAFVISTQAYKEAGGLDPQLGTGSPSPWQSAEGTDLFLTLMESHRVVTLPCYSISELPSSQEDYAAHNSAAKARRYARGTGYVYRKHYGVKGCAKCIIGPVIKGLGSVVRRDFDRVHLQAQVFLGRLEGLIHRPFTQIR